MVSVIRLAICIALVLVTPGCENPNKMFEGRWESTLSEYDAFDGQLRGVPHLAIGHFGLEVTGVAFFYKTQGGSALETSCSCTFIEQREAHRIDLSARTLSFSTACVGLDSGSDDTASNAIDWNLQVELGDTVEERYLIGTVSRADGGDEETIRLKRTSVILDQADKECDP